MLVPMVKDKDSDKQVHQNPRVRKSLLDESDFYSIHHLLHIFVLPSIKAYCSHVSYPFNSKLPEGEYLHTFNKH